MANFARLKERTADVALQDYADLDEDDFYGQDFDEDGVVSVWVGLDNLPSWPAETDLCRTCVVSVTTTQTSKTRIGTMTPLSCPLRFLVSLGGRHTRLPSSTPAANETSSACVGSFVSSTFGTSQRT